MKNTFRTAAVGGFNRQDVTEYITKSAAEAAESIRVLEQQRDEYAAAAAEKEQLAAEAEGLREQVAELTAQLEQAKAENARLQGAEEAKAALEAKVEALEEQAEEYRRLKDHIAQVELDARQRSEEIVSQAEATAAKTVADAENCAARMKADAENCAAAVRTGARKEVQAVAADYAAMLRDFDVMRGHITGELRKMDVSFTQLPLAFNKVGSALKALEQMVAEE